MSFPAKSSGEVSPVSFRSAALLDLRIALRSRGMIATSPSWRRHCWRVRVEYRPADDASSIIVNGGDSHDHGR